MFKTIKILPAFLFLLAEICCSQVTPDLSFRHLNIDNGLSHNLVNSIYQDHMGYIWIGTQDGLNKYDGYANRIYRNNPLDSSSIPSNTVTCIYQDSHNDLWIGLLDFGIAKYNYDYDCFEPLGFEEAGIQTKQVLCMYEDREKNFWVGTQDGLYLFDRNSGKAQPIPFLEYKLDKNAASSAAIFDIFEDNRGRLWLGSYNGLNLFDPLKGEFKHFFISGDQTAFSNENWIRNIFEGWDGQLWMCTQRGFKIFDLEKKQFYDGFEMLNISPTPENLRLNRILLDRENNIWFCGWQRNYFYSAKDKKLLELSHDEFDISSLSGNSITECYMDNIGGIWLGTWNAGVNYYNRGFQKFGLIQKTPESNSLTGKIIRAIITDENDDLWLGIDIGGLNHIERKTGKINHIRHIPGSENSLIHDNIRHLLWEDEKRMWIATQAGLDLYSIENNSFRHFLNDPLNKNSLIHNDIRFLMKDVYGNLWIGTFGGLSMLNPERDQFTSFKHDENSVTSLSDDRIYCLFEDSDKKIWVGTGDGLNRLERKSSTFTRFRNIPGDTASLSSNRVITIFEDSRNRLWIGTYGGGLNLFDRKNQTFKSYSYHDGLSNNVVYGILEDDREFLWLSTNQGLTRFDPESEDFVRFKKEDGLQSNQFYFNSFHKSEQGELFFGGVNGLNYFFPSQIHKDLHRPEVVITSFKLFNQEVSVDDPPGSDGILKKHISRTDTLILKHNQSVFSLGYTAIHHAQPIKNQYAYKLAGLEEKWNFVGDVRLASYSNLDPGEYIFRVKASNSDNVWNEQGASLFIKVLPPWWETTWFRIVLIFMIVTVLYLLFFMISNQEKLKANLKLERIQAAQAREMDELKQKFYSNISHEFRTPLTLILGPVEKLIKEKTASEEKKLHFNIIHKNASRLLKLVNQMLDLTRIESGFMKLNVARADIMIFISSIADSFNYRAENLDIRYSKNLDPPSFDAYFDGDKLEKILYNLLSNAFKYTPAGGSVQLIVRLEKPVMDDDSSVSHIRIEVRDTGKGIPASMQDKIFDRFVQLETDKLENTGTGIGLTLAKQLAGIHKGTIELASDPGKGSVFIVKFPITRNAYLDEEIKEDQKLPDIFYEKEDILISAKQENESKLPLVLIIDDNPDIRLFIKENLTDQFCFAEARDGSEGYEKVRDLSPDLIVCDIMMEGMNGLELCKKIKADPEFSHIPFLLVTALPGNKDKLAGLRAGAEDYIVKPFQLQELELKLRNLYRSARQTRELYSKTIRLAPSDIHISPEQEVFLKKAIASVEKDIDDPEFGIEALGRTLGTSRMQLYRKIRAATGQTVKEFIRDLRLERACQLLKNKDLTINEVAYMSGFREISYFRKCFKKKFGKTPSSYAEEVRG